MPEQAVSKLGYYYKDGQLYKVSAGVGVELVSTLPATGRDGTVYLTNANASSEGSVIEFPAPASEDEGKVFAVGSEGAVVLAQGVTSVGGQSGAVSVKTVNGQGLVGSGNVAVQETLVSGTNIKTINSTTVLGSGNFNLATKAESLKALYHLGAYDSVDTSNADYDLITRNCAFKNAWEVDFEEVSALTENGVYPCSFPSGSGEATPTSEVTIVANGFNSKFGNWTPTEDYQILQYPNDSSFRIIIDGCTSIAEAKAYLQAHNVVLCYKTATSYTEKVLKNQPLSTLDQNGENWLRGEYEKTLNLFDLGFSSWSNTITDTKNYFNFVLYINGSWASGKHIDSTGIQIITFTTSSWVSTWSLLHSGSAADIWIVKDNTKCPLKPNTTYTLSFNVIGYNPSSVGGLSISNIMLVEGDTPKPFVDYNGKVMHAIDVEGVLLWQNGNEDTSFGEQTISVPNMSAYKYLMFGFKINSSATSITQYFKIKCKNSSGGYAWFSFIDDSSTDTYKRTIKINSMTSITFNAGYRNSSTTPNSCIPTTIYGIK